MCRCRDFPAQKTNKGKKGERKEEEHDATCLVAGEVEVVVGEGGIIVAEEGEEEGGEVEEEEVVVVVVVVGEGEGEGEGEVVMERKMGRKRHCFMALRMACCPKIQTGVYLRRRSALPRRHLTTKTMDGATANTCRGEARHHRQ